MSKSQPRSHEAEHAIPLDAVVGEVELRLASLANALRGRDSEVIESSASELHRALANAVQCFMHVAEHGGVPEPLRRRLARASAMVAAQRESLARATAALDRAIDVLMPMPPASSFYSAKGLPDSFHRGGRLSA